MTLVCHDIGILPDIGHIDHIDHMTMLTILTILVFQTNPVGVGLLPYAKTFFCSDNFASIMATWVNTLYFCNMHTAAVQKNKIKIRLPRFIINMSYQPNFMTFHRSLKDPADVDSWKLIIIIIIIMMMIINNIYPRSPVTLAVFSGARFSGHHHYGEVTY